MSAPTESREFEGRVALITGGTSGTGYRSAERFLAAGASVVVNGRDPERTAGAARRLAAVSPKVDAFVADCGEHAEARHAVDFTVERFGALDVLVSAGASGTGDPKPFAEMAPDEMIAAFETRFRARVFPVHAALPALRERPGSSIVMLTTDAGRHVTVGESIIGAYAASIIQLTKGLARELSRDRVRVNAVSMTLTRDTRSWERIFGSESFQSDLFEKAIGRFPFGAPPSSAEVADAVCFLASERAAQITGQTLSVNGGLSFGGW